MRPKNPTRKYRENEARRSKMKPPSARRKERKADGDNAFERLVSDLNEGRLGLTMVGIAVKAHVRQNPDIPEPVKDLLCGKGDCFPGLLSRHWNLLGEMIGTTELAYRRGADKDGGQSTQD